MLGSGKMLRKARGDAMAAAFRPARWLLAHHPAQRISTPFGVGPRVCPGR